MIKVHHLNQSRSQRVIWLLEELAMPYELVLHQRDNQTRLAPQSLKKIHPLGKAPVMTDGDVVICESGAIMEYLLNLDEHPSMRPALNDPQYYHYLEWLHFAEGSLSLPVLTTLFMQMEKRQGDAPMDGYIAKEIAVDFDYIESWLSQHQYFAGDQFSAADIMMTFTLEIAANLGLITTRPAISHYLDKVQQRAAYIKAASHG